MGRQDTLLCLVMLTLLGSSGFFAVGVHGARRRDMDEDSFARILQLTPSSSPTEPTFAPSRSPSLSPTTSRPTAVPSKRPTTSIPTKSPTSSTPSHMPSKAPTSSKPTESPSKRPTTSVPTKSPSGAPSTSKPTEAPSKTPTSSAPTKSPTWSTPTNAPSKAPTTSVPTQSPTSSKPTATPSSAPTTSMPTKSPSTSIPTRSPSNAPTSSVPTQSPSSSTPTMAPSVTPTSSNPTTSPTTSLPTMTPSRSPTTSTPTKQPSTSPTVSSPTKSPTVSAPTRSPTLPGRPNVLFLVVDDLKPLLGSYGAPMMPENGTQNMDRIVNEGISFMNAHAQMSFCGPSRASFLTSMRSDAIKVFNIGTANQLNTQIAKTRFRKEILTLPKLFKIAGYNTYGVGKVFHENEFTLMQRADTWTVPMYSWVNKLKRAPVFSTPYQGSWINAPDVDDDFFSDGQAARLAAKLLTDLLAPNATKGDTPWFLAVGFWKPHLPWSAPKKYFDQCGPSSNFNGAFDVQTPTNMRAADFSVAKGDGCGEVKLYNGAPYNLNAGKASPEALRQANRAYHATTMYSDAQIGIVLDALEASGSRDDTLIVLVGDHGFHLGDKGLYCKHTNFEQATKSPLVIVPPRRDRDKYPVGKKAYAPVELLDIMPTLAEMASLHNFVDLSKFVAWQGLSLMPILKDPDNGYVKQAALSQYFRGRGSKMIWGYSVRTTRYRYTVWGNKKFEELYDYLSDDWETVSLQKNTQLKTQLNNFAYYGGRVYQGNNKAPFDFADRLKIKAKPARAYA